MGKIILCIVLGAILGAMVAPFFPPKIIEGTVIMTALFGIGYVGTLLFQRLSGR